jgi:transcriptional regulator with XRE-family HTH domain
MAQPRSDAHFRYGFALRQLRADRGFSQESLALAAGLDRAYVSGIERGERNPSLANLLELAAAVGVPFWEWARRAEE